MDFATEHEAEDRMVAHSNPLDPIESKYGSNKNKEVGDTQRMFSG
jgi:hypothetical protein